MLRFAWQPGLPAKPVAPRPYCNSAILISPFEEPAGATLVAEGSKRNLIEHASLFPLLGDKTWRSRRSCYAQMGEMTTILNRRYKNVTFNFGKYSLLVFYRTVINEMEMSTVSACRLQLCEHMTPPYRHDWALLK